MTKDQQIALIQEKLGLDRSTIRALGIHQCMLQVHSLETNSAVLKCDADSSASGETLVDILPDLQQKGKERGS